MKPGCSLDVEGTRLPWGTPDYSYPDSGHELVVGSIPFGTCGHGINFLCGGDWRRPFLSRTFCCPDARSRCLTWARNVPYLSTQKATLAWA
eukprot:363340-Chlamydomonas_euryale.AAC.5